MKTAEEWFNELVARPKYQSDCNAIISQGTIMQIQLDAWRQGMTDAAEISNRELTIGWQDKQHWSVQAILTARDNKKEI